MRFATQSELVASELPADSAGAGTHRSALNYAFPYPVMLAGGLVLVTFFTVHSRLNDPDTWWHLKIGEIIWKTHSIPQSDHLSYTTHNHAWLSHEWLAQLTIYGAYRLSGNMGLWIWMFVLSALIVVALYALCSWYSGNSKLSLMGGLAGWLFATVGLAVRPQLLGYLLLVLELLILHAARSKDRRWLWTLPPLFALWVNCHGSYALGLLVLGVCTLCSYVDLEAGSVRSIRRDHNERFLWTGVFLLCGTALLANPVGPKLLTYPLNTITAQTESLAGIAEWQPLGIRDPRGPAFFGLAGAIGLVFLIRSRVVYLEELILLGLGLTMALRHVRMLFVFGILAAPILCRLLADLWDRYEPDHDNRVANAVVICGSALAMILAFPTRQDLDRQVRSANPVGAVDFIRRAGLTGPMLNSYVWGGYLIWALPQQRVFIDGRGDVFDWTGVLGEYGRWATLGEDPALLLDKYDVQYCLLGKGDAVAQVLPYLPGWRKAYHDELSVVFVRDARPPQLAAMSE